MHKGMGQIACQALSLLPGVEACNLFYIGALKVSVAQESLMNKSNNTLRSIKFTLSS